MKYINFLLCFFSISVFGSTYEEAVEHLFEGDNNRAIYLLGSSVSDKDVRSMELLAYLYSGTPFVKEDLNRSDHLYSMAGASGSIEAKINNGKVLFDEKEYEKSFDIFLDVSKENHPKAFFYIGMHYLSGLGTKRDFELSKINFDKSKNGWVNKYNSENIMSFVNFHMNGGIRGDGLTYLIRSANLGYEAAQSTLANILIKSGDKDYALIKSWIDISDTVGYGLVDVDRKYLDENVTKKILDDADVISKKWFLLNKGKEHSPYSEAAAWCANDSTEKIECLKKSISHHISCTVDMQYDSFAGWYESKGYDACRASLRLINLSNIIKHTK